MAVTYIDLFEADPDAGDTLSGNEILPFDPDPNSSPDYTKAMTLTQLISGIDTIQGYSENLSSNLKETTIAATGMPESTYFFAKPRVNSLIYDIAPISTVYERYTIQVNNSTPPTNPTDGTAGTFPKTGTLPNYNKHILYPFGYNGSTWVAVNIYPLYTGVGFPAGFPIQAIKDRRNILLKDPDIDYLLQASFSSVVGDTYNIVDVDWTIPVGITAFNTFNNYDTAYIILAGGLSGEVYTPITCTITYDSIYTSESGLESSMTFAVYCDNLSSVSTEETDVIETYYGY